MKKLILVLVTVLACVTVFAACGEEEAPVEMNYSAPEDVYEHTLKLQFYGDIFRPHRPTMILFAGYNRYNEKDSLALDPDIYYHVNDNEGALSSWSKNMDLNLVNYWRKAGFNVGIFHYEAFADDDYLSVMKKVYDKQAMTYKNRDNQTIEVVESGIDYSLTDYFVNEWLKVLKDAPIAGTTYSYNVQEVRFVGDGVGAYLALNAANRLYDLFTQNRASGWAVPARVSLLNPKFASGLLSANQYNAVESLVTKLADAGTVFELIEPANEISDNERLLKNVAHLAFRETYSNAKDDPVKRGHYPDEYRKLERSIRDWYLYSVNGSDDSVGFTGTAYNAVRGYNETLPMLDFKSGGGSSSIARYSVSAWTPTSYMRALRGLKFVMQEYRWVSSAAGYQYLDYSLSQMHAETFQISNMTGYNLCGYVYSRDDGSDFVNYSYGTRLANVEIEITIWIDREQRVRDVFKVYTDNGGFYCFTVALKQYPKTVEAEIRVVPPKNYRYSVKLADATEYHRMSLSFLEGSGNTFSIAQDLARGQYLVRNCGLIKRG